MSERFHDDGVRLEQFVTSLDVVCPSCGGRGEVRSRTADAPARVVCRDCSFAAREDVSGWLGPLTGVVVRRCPSCGERLERRVGGPRHDHPVHLVSECGWTVDAPLHWDPVRTEGSDPFFGLELRLRAPFRGELLWAYNAEHLAFLKRYVGATVREREPNQNGSLVSRLPQWIKSAKHRDDLLAAITKLEART
jgi:predicted RNA-binding Zn-ribbon protein involved in translation (DUF1610 family)